MSSRSGRFLPESFDDDGSKIFDDDNSSEDDNQDQPDNLNYSQWKYAQNADIKPDQVSKGRLSQFERAQNWQKDRILKAEQPEVSGAETSICYKQVRLRLQFSREPYRDQPDQARVIPYTNLRSEEFKTVALPPAVMHTFEKDMKKGILKISHCVALSDMMENRNSKERAALFFTRFPQWGMDFDRELLYMSIKSTLSSCASFKTKNIYFPSMINPEAPMDDYVQIILQSIIDFIDNEREPQHLPEAIIIRVQDRDEFKEYVTAFISKARQIVAERQKARGDLLKKKQGNTSWTS